MSVRYRAAAKNLPLDIDGKLAPWPFAYTATGINLTGFTAVMKFFDAPGGTLLLDASAGVVLGGAAGTVLRELTTGEQALLGTSGFYVHEIKNADGKAQWRLYGDYQVLSSGA